MRAVTLLSDAKAAVLLADEMAEPELEERHEAIGRKISVTQPDIPPATDENDDIETARTSPLRLDRLRY